MASEADWLFPHREIPLQQFVRRAIIKELALRDMADTPERQQKIQQQSRHLLTGINDDDPNDVYQSKITVMRYALTDAHQPILRRDYDSLIAFTKVIPTRMPFFIYVVPRIIDTLKESLHLKIKMQIAEGEQVQYI